MTLPAPYYDDGSVTIYHGDALDVMAEMALGSVQCCVTSPPYWGLRKYDGEQERAWADGITCPYGAEPTIAAYVSHTVEVLRAVRRVLRDDGTVWWAVGDSYANTGHHGGHSGGKSSACAAGVYPRGRKAGGIAHKNLCLVPQRVAIAAQDDGWYVRSIIVWAKPNPMPESVKGSHYLRHRVTMAEYERLSRLRKAHRNSGQGTSNVSDLPAGKGVGSQAPVSTQPEGTGDGQGQGRTRRRKGKAAAIQPVTTGKVEPRQVPSNGEGQGRIEETGTEVPCQRRWQTKRCRAPLENEGPAGADRATTTGERTLPPNGQVPGKEASGLRPPKSGDSARPNSDSGRLVGNTGTAQAPLSLLWQAEGLDARPRDSIEQRGEAREREYRPGLPKLQLEEEQQGDSTLVDCPGCPQCERNDGYVPLLSAGRPTTAHEYILLLSKQPRYYYDSEAVREESTHQTGSAVNFARATKEAEVPGQSALQHRIGRVPTVDNGGRNLRSVWNIATTPFRGAHFATFPPELPRRCIMAASRPGDVVLDCFAGSGTTGAVAKSLGRRSILIDRSEKYCAMAARRVQAVPTPMRLESGS